jgi:hypothetical protein
MPGEEPTCPGLIRVQAEAAGKCVIIRLMSKRVVRSPAERLLGYRRVLETRNPDTPAERLNVLAIDEIRPVRLWVARNRATPPAALARLAQDEDYSVQWNALLNPNLPDSALRSLAQQEAEESNGRWFISRRLIVHHPNVSDELREQLVAVGACECPRPCGRYAYQVPPPQ